MSQQAAQCLSTSHVKGPEAVLTSLAQLAAEVVARSRSHEI